MLEIIVMGTCLRMLSREHGVQKNLALWLPGVAGCWMIDGKWSLQMRHC